MLYYYMYIKFIKGEFCKSLIHVMSHMVSYCGSLLFMSVVCLKNAILLEGTLLCPQALLARSEYITVYCDDLMPYMC